MTKKYTFYLNQKKIKKIRGLRSFKTSTIVLKCQLEIIHFHSTTVPKYKELKSKTYFKYLFIETIYIQT